VEQVAQEILRQQVQLKDMQVEMVLLVVQLDHLVVVEVLEL
tara:strand:- start:277 stop:399 length:123 start_codon:yes stop_codon:yes gene_type:complete